MTVASASRVWSGALCEADAALAGCMTRMCCSLCPCQQLCAGRFGPRQVPRLPTVYVLAAGATVSVSSACMHRA